MKKATFSKRAATGIPGLDGVLGGGFPENRLILISGHPGTGKTTLAMQFLQQGARQGQRGLYITLSETQDELQEIADSHGWSLEGIDIFELSALEQQLAMEAQNTLFHPADVELSQTTQLLLNQINKIKPSRLVLDSLSELRLLAQNSLRYRRQLLGFKQAFATINCTVLVLDDLTADSVDLQVESIAHGVISLKHFSPDYGSDRRKISVKKLRGSVYTGGYHDYVIQTGGMQVFPRLIAMESRGADLIQTVESDVPELDKLLGGGLDEGTSTLFMGPSGVGKSTLALQYAVSAANRGKKTICFTFDETTAIIRKRLSGLKIPFDQHLNDGTIQLRQVDPGELAPGEFGNQIRQSVEQDGVRVVIIDSLNGYLNAMPDDRFLILQMHELLSYLNQKGVLTLLAFTQHGMLGQMKSPIDVTYLSDTVILFRFFETGGEIKRAISVIKKRSGMHESFIREFQLDQGVHVGKALTEFHGVLTGTPQFVGDSQQMLKSKSNVQP